MDALWSRLVCCLACFLMQKRKGKDSIFSEKFINLHFKSTFAIWYINQVPGLSDAAKRNIQEAIVKIISYIFLI